MKKWVILGFMGLFCLSLSCSGLGKPKSNKFILLASTIGPIDSGIVDLLENEFEKETGIRVRHVGAGTGAALDIAKKGNVDLVLVHAKSLEEKFVQEGFGTERIDLMYNDFVIVGPLKDPAGIRGHEASHRSFEDYFPERGNLYQSWGQVRDPCGRDGIMGKSRDQTRWLLVRDL